MKRFFFWQKWLFVVGIGTAMFGLILAFFPHTGFINFLINDRIDQVFWNSEIPENALNHQAWQYGVLGATITSWGILLAFIVHYPFKGRRRWAWQALVAALLFWYVPDTVLSIAYSVSYNVIFNTVLLLLLGIPLLATRREFSNSQE